MSHMRIAPGKTKEGCRPGGAWEETLGSRGAVAIHFQPIATIWDCENSIGSPSSDLFFLVFKKDLIGYLILLRNLFYFLLWRLTSNIHKSR